MERKKDSPKIESFQDAKILTFEGAIEKIAQIRATNGCVVLAQGVFDILHLGHVYYLREANLSGYTLFVGVENDEGVRRNKGSNRPFNPLNDRLKMLSELHSVDFVFPFNDINGYLDSSAFTRRLRSLNPNLLAVSNHDSLFNNKRASAAAAGVELLTVKDPWITSTTEIAHKLGLE